MDATHQAQLGNISLRALHVWRRNAEVLLTTWYTNFLPPLLEPVFYVLAFGFGIGGLVGDFAFQGQEMSYLQFVAPGVVAVAVMFWSFFETTYSSFVRFGLLAWPTALWVLPLAAFGGLMFASIGLIVTALSPKIEAFNLPIFLFIFPMFLFSGTFFPLEQLPGWAHSLAMALPLTHTCALIRGACLGLTPPQLDWHLSYVLIGTPTIGILALRLMYRRLVK